MVVSMVMAVVMLLPVVVMVMVVTVVVVVDMVPTCQKSARTRPRVTANVELHSQNQSADLKERGWGVGA